MNGEASEYEVHIHPDGSTMVLGPPSDLNPLFSNPAALNSGS